MNKLLALVATPLLFATNGLCFSFEDPCYVDDEYSQKIQGLLRLITPPQMEMLLENGTGSHSFSIKPINITLPDGANINFRTFSVRKVHSLDESQLQDEMRAALLNGFSIDYKNVAMHSKQGEKKGYGHICFSDNPGTQQWNGIMRLTLKDAVKPIYDIFVQMDLLITLTHPAPTTPIQSSQVTPGKSLAQF